MVGCSELGLVKIGKKSFHYNAIMFKKSSWLHLRIGFSVFLLPVFLFSLAFVEDLEVWRLALVFVTLHFFLYPSSNGYNSYYDKDEDSIGGLKNPPKVDKGLLFLSLFFLAFSLVLGLMINVAFSSMLLVYSLVSMAYSHPSIRIDRKSTRLNSSHVRISYAVFCLKKKKKRSVVGACSGIGHVLCV